MKKIGILVLFLAFGAISYAQSLKDKFFLGGSLGLAFNSEKYKGISPSVNSDAYKYCGINPAFGYYLSDKWGLGLMAGYQLETRKITTYYNDYTQGIYSIRQYTQIQKDRSFKISPFVRYTKFIGEKFVFNLNFSIPYLKGKNYYQSDQQPNYEIGHKYQSIGIAINPEVQFFASNKITINACFGGLNYAYKKSKFFNTNYNNIYNSEKINNNLEFSLSTGLQIGVSFFFGESK